MSSGGPHGWSEGGVPAPEPASDSMLLSIGDIAVYPDRVVTPSGTQPLRGLTWIMRDNSITTEEIPVYAIILCVLFIGACGLGLLFLLIKERKTQGYVEVSVQSPSSYHVTQIRAVSPQQVELIRQQVEYTRNLVHYL